MAWVFEKLLSVFQVFPMCIQVENHRAQLEVTPGRGPGSWTSSCVRAERGCGHGSGGVSQELSSRAMGQWASWGGRRQAKNQERVEGLGGDT